MSGICGFYSDAEISYDTLVEMTGTMAHRGPDSDGLHVQRAEEKWLGFGHRSLSLNGASPDRNQPMFSNDKSVCVILDGKIYNYRTIIKGLHGKYQFRSKSDAEIVIAAYLQWGIGFLEKVNGIFAIALYDFKKCRLILARDRVGEKPLYYYHKDGVLLFGSELKPLMNSGVFPKDIRKDIMAKYMCYGYVNAPDTIFKNTYKLEPGTYAIADKNGLETKKYWNIIERFNVLSSDQIYSYEACRAGLKKLLVDSVKKRMICDAPLGALISGGVDSSLITALAQEISGGPIKTFGIGFKAADYNEAVYAAKVARHLKTDHTELYADYDELAELAESIPYYYDEPMADSSQLPTMLVSKLAKSGVGVVLTGDGGDEVFCGYNSYDGTLNDQKQDVFGYIYRTLEKTGAFKDLTFLEVFAPNIKQLAANNNISSKTQIDYASRVLSAQGLIKSESAELRYLIEDSIETKSWQEKRMLVDMLTCLPGDMLCKVDRAAMKYALEARCPLLDHRVIEYSFRIPHKYKYKNGSKKYILKDILFDYVPSELIERPKQGFAVPYKKILKDYFLHDLERYSSKEFIEEQDIFVYPKIKQLVTTFINKGVDLAFQRVWFYFVFQKWYETYIKSV